jgi:hypothetical protein
MWPMENYLLFKQLVCIILFIETLILWSKFKIYFGPQAFPKSLFTSHFRIHAFHFTLLTSLIFLFLNFYAVVASFFIFLSMRYLFVTDAQTRISTFGAVGHICYLVSAYIFFFEVAFIIDPSHHLVNFLHAILAIEIGIMMVSAGLHKYASGYTQNNGIEYALVNPSWGKFFFLFKKLKPSSWFFKVNNYAAFFLELLSGILFFFPPTQILGAYLLSLLFFYAFLTLRVNILPFLMMGLALLYIQPIVFHFPIINRTIPQISVDPYVITFIEGIFIVYIALNILITLFRLYQLITEMPTSRILIKPVRFFMLARPHFDWNVFTFRFTDYFINIEKVSKASNEITEIIYDGFSKNYREIFTNARLFFRFIHHHESSFLIGVFSPMRIVRKEEMEAYLNVFLKKMVMYAKTHLSDSELKDTTVVFKVMHIKKVDDAFVYELLTTFYVDPKSEAVTMSQP